MNLLNNYPQGLREFVKGKGVYLFDKKGGKYLDFSSGIAVNSIGYSHPIFIKNISAQLKKIIHISNLFTIPPHIKLAEELHKIAFGKIFLANSGAEANEAAIKLARKWGKKFSSQKYEIITFEGSFHGRTMATVTATAQAKYQKPFTPLLKGFKYALFNDIKSVKKLINKNTAAIMVEPVQGEGGVVPAKLNFLRELKKLCVSYNALLVFDEVQTGMGRCGDWFAYKRFNVKPDILTSAKALGGGIPIGAVMCDTKKIDFDKGDHASTFGGNYVSSTAALSVIHIIKKEKILEGVKKNEKIIFNALKVLLKNKKVKDVRGMGYMWGIQLDESLNPADIMKKCLSKGLVILTAGGNTLRLLPPLIMKKEEIIKGINIIKGVLDES